MAKKLSLNKEINLNWVVKPNQFTNSLTDPFCGGFFCIMCGTLGTKCMPPTIGVVANQ